MKPQQGDFVVVFLRIGIPVEGEVIDWSDEVSTLKSSAGSSTIVIQHTIDDVVFYKISHAKKEFEKVKESLTKEDDEQSRMIKLKRLSELKVELNSIERSELKDKLSKPTTSYALSSSYNLPSSLLKK